MVTLLTLINGDSINFWFACLVLFQNIQGMSLRYINNIKMIDIIFHRYLVPYVGFKFWCL